MKPVPSTAADMISRGELEATQSARVVDLADARGAIRLRLPQPEPAPH